MNLEYTEVELTTPLLESWYDAGCNVALIGRHGTGKTACITAVFNKKCPGKWKYFSGSTLDPFTDLIGIPKEKIVNGEPIIAYVRPEGLQNDVEAIFVDEYNRSHKKVRNAIMELVQFKRINGVKFPNLKVVWVACNPPQDSDDDDNDFKYDVEEVDPAQLDRFHVTVRVKDTPNWKYLASLFGDENSSRAKEWFDTLPKGIYISPRRVEYAMKAIIEDKLSATHLLPKEANPRNLDDKLKRTALTILLEKTTNTDALEKIFRDSKNQAELIHLFKTDTAFRKKWIMFYTFVSRESVKAAISSEGLEKLFGITFDIHSAHGSDKILRALNQPHENRNTLIFLNKVYNLDGMQYRDGSF